MLLPLVEIEPPRQATHCIIWLHGLGADGHDFEPIVPELGLELDHGIRFVFPHAPVRPITINGGMAMRAWYDIQRIAADGMDLQHIEESSAQVQRLIEAQEAAGIDSSRIILAGFSQGGTIALHTALGLRSQLAGVIALSTWLPPNPTLQSTYNTTNRHTPLFLAHGKQDPVVPFPLGTMTRDYLHDQCTSIEWHDYPTGHQVCAAQIADLGHWIKSRVNEENPA